MRRPLRLRAFPPAGWCSPPCSGVRFDDAVEVIPQMKPAVTMALHAWVSVSVATFGHRPWWARSWWW